MISSLFEEYLGHGPRRRLRGRQTAGLAVTLAIHALFILAAVKARFEVKIFPVEKKIVGVYLGPRVKVNLPADYKKRLADMDLLDSGGDVYLGDVGRVPAKGGGDSSLPVPAGPETAAAPGAVMPEGASGAFVLSYRPGAERGEVPDFDLRPPAETAPGAGRRVPGATADPRLKAYPSTDVRRGEAGEGYAMARSSTGDRVVYRGRLPAGAQSVELGAWGRQVVEAVQKSWVLPLTGAEWKGGQVAVTVVVDKDGRASLVRINNSSNLALLDRSALAAVTASLPFPPLPEDFPGRSLETFFLFDCHGK